MPRIVLFNKIGDSQVLEIKEVAVEKPGADEVQIRVHAIGINRAEIMYRTGQYVIQPQFPARLGYEAAGTVESVGSNVTGFAVGDKVSVIPSFMFSEYGMYGEVVNAPVHAVVKNPDGQTFEEAAATWMMFVTAYGALVEYGEIKPGDYVLISAASSSVGLAAIQISNMVGAIPIALTRTGKKRDMLIKAGAAEVIAIQEEDMTTEIQRITKNQGARIAFDPIGGPGVAQISHALSQGGIFFQYGALDSRDLSIPVMDILGKHLTFRGYELFEITTSPEKLSRAKRFICEGIKCGKLKPVIDKVFPFEKIADSHRYMEANGQVGKIIVSI